MPDDRERIYRAICAYLDERISIEMAARRFGVNPHTLRDRMRQQGFPIRSWKETGKQTHGDRSAIPESAVAASLSGEPTWRLAQKYGVSVRSMQEWLRERGVDGRARFLTRHAEEQSSRARSRVEKIIRLRDSGLTYGQIAIRTGESRGYVSAAASRYDRGLYRWQKTTTTTSREEV